MTRATDHGFITEAEVIEIWPMIPPTDIRRARRNGSLPFYQFPGGPHYRPKDVEAFIERKYRRGLASEMHGAPSALTELAAPTPIASPDNFKPARPVLLRPPDYETMAAEEARIQVGALAKRRQGGATAAEASPMVTDVPLAPEVARPETSEEEIDRLRGEVYADRIANRPTVAQRKKAEAAAAAKRGKPSGKGQSGVRSKTDRP